MENKTQELNPEMHHLSLMVDGKNNKNVDVNFDE